ncbi:hypothetical protein [Streptomyces olivaceoviridis]|uniref:hypothetical protein n=1 Tax=Streptomyces olivaceoviridis TaxID=1921 RepID=UPI0036F99811
MAPTTRLSGRVRPRGDLPVPGCEVVGGDPVWAVRSFTPSKRYGGHAQVCDGSNGQEWTTNADGRLVHTLSDRCLLPIWMCGGSAQRKWSLLASA